MKNGYLWRTVSALLAGLLLLTLGVIVGAVYSSFVLTNLSAVVAVAVVWLVLLLVSIIIRNFFNRR